MTTNSSVDIGSTTQTTLGTVTTGTWNATIISPVYGGTGVNNGASTITLGGSLITSGAFASTFTMTGATSVTFPTSGTLATTASASGIVNSGLINQLAYYAAPGSTVSGLATAVSGALITDGSGVPSISSTLPSVVQGNITSTGALTSGSLGIGFTAVTVPIGGTGATSLTAYMPICGGTTSTGTVQSVSTSGASAGYVLTFVSTSALPTWQAAGGGGLSFNGVSGTTQAAAVNTGYICQNASLTTVTLPATAALGSVVVVVGQGAGGWTLAANTGQTIQVGATASSSGGSVSSAQRYDNIQVVCIVANTTWSVYPNESSGFPIV